MTNMVKGIFAKHTETEEILIVFEYNGELRYVNTHDKGDIEPPLLYKTDDFYEHYKGNLYWVIDNAKPLVDDNNEEALVVYGDVKNNVWCRPYDMFYGSIEIDGDKVPRFKKVMI